jgi:hypothetical protein
MSSFYYAIDMINNRSHQTSDCSNTTIKPVKKEEVVGAHVDSEPFSKCTHCNMFGHLVGDCAMLTTGEYADDNEPGKEDEEEGNVLTEEEFEKWMRDVEEEDEYAEDHSPEADVRWTKQSSMAAFDHFQRTGAQLKNSEFVGKKAGAPLRSERDGMDE